MRRLWGVLTGATIVLYAGVARAQEMADAPDDPALAAATAAFDAGSKAYTARQWATARAHFEKALELSTKAFPENPGQRNIWQAGAYRAVASTYAYEGNAAACVQAGRQAWAQILVTDGNPREEELIQQSVYACLDQLGTTPERVALLVAWREALTHLLPDPAPPRDETLRRLRWQIGQAWHDQADVEQAAGLLEEAAETLRRAIAFRHTAGDALGTAWSCQNRFWILLRLDKDGEAAAQAAHTIERIRKGVGLNVEARLAANLEAWLDARVAKGEYDRALRMLGELRAAGACEGLGLTTLPASRLLSIELGLLHQRPAPTAADAVQAQRAHERLLAEGLVATGDNERNAAAQFDGAMELARLALSDEPPAGTVSEAQARTALRIAEQLDDPHRAAQARLAIAAALSQQGKPAEAEAIIREVFIAAGRPQQDPWLRELARRTGATLAAGASNAEWAELYAFSVQPAPQLPAQGHSWIGVDIATFWRGVNQLPGDGAVLTITRVGRHLVLRSPLATGAQAVEWGWRLRYVNANGIILAVQGPDVAVAGRATELGAPAAPGGTVTRVEDGLDLAALRAPGLALLTPQVTLHDGETAFVNRFLRIHR